MRQWSRKVEYALRSVLSSITSSCDPSAIGYRVFTGQRSDGKRKGSVEFQSSRKSDREFDGKKRSAVFRRIRHLSTPAGRPRRHDGTPQNK
jgi:hypothetical protein